MSIQAQLNQEAIDMLPLVKKEIQDSVSDFGRNQKIEFTIRAACNCRKPLDSMSDDEKLEFQNDLLNYFKHMRWI